MHIVIVRFVGSFRWDCKQYF